MEFIFYSYIGYTVYLKKKNIFFLKIKKNEFCKNARSKLTRKSTGIWEVNCIHFKKCMIA